MMHVSRESSEASEEAAADVAELQRRLQQSGAQQAMQREQLQEASVKLQVAEEHLLEAAEREHALAAQLQGASQRLVSAEQQAAAHEALAAEALTQAQVDEQLLCLPTASHQVQPFCNHLTQPSTCLWCSARLCLTLRPFICARAGSRGSQAESD